MHVVSPRVLVTLSAINLSMMTTPVSAQEFGAAPNRSHVITARSSADSASVVAVVERLHTALARGDSAAVLALLAPDIVILESGAMERRDDYRRHHLAADIEFSRAIPAVHTVASVVVHGDAAWVSSTSVTQGTFKERAINSAGSELIVLARTDARTPWQIRAVHWSSRRRTP